MYRSARPLLGLTTGAAAGLRPRTIALPLPLARAALSTTATRPAKAATADARMAQRLFKANIKTADKGYSSKEMEKGMAMTHIMLPGTFVPLPFSQLDKSPRALLAYTLARLTQRAKDLLTLLGAKVSSMPTWTRRPLAQLGSSQIAPTAKALHLRLAQAMAAGDKDALREVCTPRLYETLSATVSRRKPGEKLTWELVRYDAAPRVVSHKIGMMPPVGRGPVVQQVVVAIASTQKLGRVDRRGKAVAGGSRVLRPTEYVVLNRMFEAKTWRQKERWLVWGYAKPTTLEDWRLEEQGIAQMERQEMERRRGKK